MNKIQKRQFKMLTMFDEICKKHKLKYFLLGGTLLGAVRHKGFIPWDDDIDVCMFREDYEKFLELAQDELGEKYFLQNVDTEKNYGLMYSKIVENNTLYLEKTAKNVDINHGIFIDIFVLDNVSNNLKDSNKKFKKILFLKMLLLIKSKYTIETNSIMKKIEVIILKFISIFTNKNRLINKLNKLMIMEEKTDYVADYSTPYFSKWKMKRNFFDEVAYYEFEGRMFPATKYYDEYLSHFYNDYMTLPPIEKRDNRHGIITVEFN